MNIATPTLFGSTPQRINITTWSLRIDGFVQRPLNLTYDELRTLPTVTVFAKLICVGGSALVTKGNWTGVQLSSLLTLAEVKPEAVEMVFYAVDGFSSSLPVEEILNRPDMLLAYEKDGEPLPDSLGYPVIVVAPGKWGYKWVRNVEHVELVDFDYRGFWESSGYSDAADIPDYGPPPEVFKLSETSQNPMTSETLVVSAPQEETAAVPEFGIAPIIALILSGLLFIGYKKRL